MPMPEHFKFDVRVRERLQRKDQLSETELEQHLTALADVSANAVEIELKQPALQTEAERAENSVIVRPAPPRPVMVAPIPIEEEDEDEEEELPVKPEKRVSAAPAAAAPAAPAPAAEEEEDDEDDEDEDDEDEDDEDDDDEDEDDAEGDDEKSPGADDGESGS